MFYTYLLRSTKNADLYIGHSSDLKERYKMHNSGRVDSTRPYLPWELIYYEAYKNKKDATKREKQLKDNHRAKSELIKQLENSLKF